MKWLVILFLLVSLNCFAQVPTYTGRAENVATNDRGITFTVVVTDGDGKEILRRDQWVSTGVMEATDAVQAIKNVVKKMTQEMWAHKEGAKETIKSKADIEIYRATCDEFVLPVDRAVIQPIR